MRLIQKMYSGKYGYYSQHIDYTQFDNMDSSGNQMFTTEDLKWRVLDVTGDRVTLIADNPTNSNLTLYGGKGYINSIQTLNDLCKYLYGNGYGVQQARSLSVDDINKICGIPENIPYTNLLSNYGKDFTARASDYWADGTSATGKLIRNTCYFYNIENYIDTNSEIYDVLYTTKKSWLASTSTNVYCEDRPDSLTNFHLHVKHFFKGGIDSKLLWHSNRWVHYFSYPVIPIVVLDSGVLTTGQDLNGVWQLSIR